MVLQTITFRKMLSKKRIILVKTTTPMNLMAVTFVSLTALFKFLCICLLFPSYSYIFVVIFCQNVLHICVCLKRNYYLYVSEKGR